MTHSQLATLFQPFGDIAYISLPKFEGTQKLKGFCFIEFQSATAIQELLGRQQASAFAAIQHYRMMTK